MVISCFLLLSVIGIVKKPESIYKGKPDEQNIMQGKKVRFVADHKDPENADGVRGHLEATGISHHNPSFYERIVKRLFDLLISFCGLVILSPLFLNYQQ